MACMIYLAILTHGALEGAIEHRMQMGWKARILTERGLATWQVCEPL